MIPDHIFNKHSNHEVAIDENPVNKKGQAITTHLAALRCVTCNKHLKWLSGRELVALGKITAAELEEYQMQAMLAKHQVEAAMLATQDQPVQDSW